MPVIEVRHPLVRHKIGLLRESGIPTQRFRALTVELARLLVCEATADLPLAGVTIEGWCGPVEVERLQVRAEAAVAEQHAFVEGPEEAAHGDGP